jgi:phosphoheptose isomerase
MNLFELAQKGRELYEKQASLSEKKELLNFVFSNLKINGDKVVPTAHNGFEVIALRAKDGNMLSGTVTDLLIPITHCLTSRLNETNETP